MSSDGYPRNFRPDEFLCNCGKRCESTDPSATKHLAWVLQQIRDLVNVPIKINSAYRCPTHNRAVGGHPKSYHMRGWAADLSPVGVDPTELHAAIEDLVKSKRIPAGGVGLYKTFVHYDIQAGPKRWRG